MYILCLFGAGRDVACAQAFPASPTPDTGIYIENQGDIALSFVIADASGQPCSSNYVESREVKLLGACGDDTKLMWNDSKNVQTLPVKRGRTYKFSWGQDSWIVTEVGTH